MACEFRVDGEVFHARVEGGRIEAALGPLPGAELALTADGATLIALGRAELDAREGVRAGRLELRGRIRDLERFLRAFR